MIPTDVLGIPLAHLGHPMKRKTTVYNGVIYLFPMVSIYKRISEIFAKENHNLRKLTSNYLTYSSACSPALFTHETLLYFWMLN